MKLKRKPYNLFQQASAFFMILALLWLTVSTPFIYSSQENRNNEDNTTSSWSPLAGNEDETANPFGNSTEEKTPSGNTFSEEYLHDHHTDDWFFITISLYHKCENAGTYIAFHGELLVPPPNMA